MHRLGSLSLATIFVAIALFGRLSGAFRSPHIPPQIALLYSSNSPDMNGLIAISTTESLLAAGQKFPLSSATEFDLQLISGISDELSQRIMKRKDLIARSAAALPGETERAFMKVQGIGPKLGLELATHVDALR